MANANLSKEFFELLKAIGESKSKQEEDRIIEREIICLKKKLESPMHHNNQPPPSSLQSKIPSSMIPGHHHGSNVNTSLFNKKKAKEFLVRLLYVEMLGHDGSFGYIKGIELAASSLISHKRTGYLVCACCLPPDHEFRFMLVNQMQRDLNSSSVLEVCAALVAVCTIITADMVPALVSEVIKLLAHGNETVRKKCIVVLYRFYTIAPEVTPRAELIEKLRRTLCDRDPSVMGSALNVIECIAEEDSLPFKDLIPSLISILKQVCENRLPSDYDYHRVPAPWIQMKIIRILGILGKKDATASNGMYEILGDCMRRADIGINAGYAVVYECVRTITGIYPNPNLLDAAAEAISRFISSRSHNLKYLGVTGLALIVEAGPQYAAPHQLAVIECLEDRDETLQRKTLDLLYRMTNPVNVEFITMKMLEFLRGTTDSFLKSSLTDRICSVAERYAPNNEWYMKVTTELFEISGDLVKIDVAQNLMSLIAEGDEDEGTVLRTNAVELYVSLLDRQKLPKILTETMAWVLGEYAYLSTSHSLSQILEKLCVLSKKTNTIAASPSTRKFLATAIIKLVAQCGTCPPCAAHVLEDFTKSRDVDLQQRCLEFQNLLTSAGNVLGDVLPVDASCEDVEVDVELYFLNDFVADAKRNGAAEYSPEDDGDDDDYQYVGDTAQAGFNITPYEIPKAPTNLSYANAIQAHDGSSNTNQQQNLGGPMGGDLGNSVSAPPLSSEPQLALRGAANVWGKGGLSTPAAQSSAPASTQAPAPPPPPTWNNTTPSSSGYSSYNKPQPVEPPKSKELTERERMAAALFGGIAPGSAVPPPAPTMSVVPTHAPPAAPAVPAAATVAAPVAPPAPAPSSEIDLLDLGFSPAPAATQQASAADPFSNFLSESSSPKPPSFQNQTLTPVQLTTPQFGQTWGSCPHTFAKQIPKSYSSPEVFLQICIGFHVVEIISATNEGIAAGSIGDCTVLLHAKIGNNGVDVIVKSMDEAIGKFLSEWLVNACNA